MKIIHCVGRLKGGGAETQLRLFLEDGNGAIQNIVVSYDREGDTGANYFQIEEKASVLKKWKEFYNICKKEEPDIIHIWLPAVFYIYGLPALFMSGKKLLGVRSVYRLNSLKRLIQFCVYCLYRNVVSNTHIDDQQGIFKMLFKFKNYHFVPNAIKFNIDSGLTNEAARKESPFKFLYVGRLVNDKNIQSLLKSLALIPTENWALTIVGTGPEKKALERIASHAGILSKITFEAFTDDIKSFYQNADALVLPSTREGMPNVVFEGAVFNNILILSDIPQHARWFKHEESAFLFSPLDIEALKWCLLRAMSLSKEENEALVLHTKAVIKELTKEKYIARYKALYGALIKKQ